MIRFIGLFYRLTIDLSRLDSEPTTCNIGDMARDILSRLRVLSAVEVAALCEAMLMMIVAASLVRFIPLRRLGALAARPLGHQRGDVAATVGRVVWAVNAAARRSPMRAMCFERGLAAQIMLRHRGVDSKLTYGVSPPRDGQPLAAHVWVRAGTFDVTGTNEAADFMPMVSFPAPNDTA